MLRSQPMRRFLFTFFRQWRLYMLNSSSTSLPISPSTRYVNMPRTLIVPSRTHMSHACESPANRLKTSRASKSNAATGSAAHRAGPNRCLASFSRFAASRKYRGRSAFSPATSSLHSHTVPRRLSKTLIFLLVQRPAPPPAIRLI